MKNLGSTDRLIRTILGVALLMAGVVLQLTSGAFWWLAIPGVVFLFTATISTCPIYMPFGLSTVRKNK